MTIDLHRLPDNRCVFAEMGLPKAVADYRHRGTGALLFLSGHECTPENRTHAQHVEIIGRCQGSVDAFRFANASQRNEIVVVRQQSREASAVVAQIRIIQVGEWRGGVVAPFAPHHGDEAARVCQTRNGVEQRRTDPAKNRAVRANAEGQGQHRHHRKAGRLHEHTKGVTDVPNQVISLMLPSQVTENGPASRHIA
jgi:hypothetical protein